MILMLPEYKMQTLQRKINARYRGIKETEKLVEKPLCSEEEAYRFFCHRFDELERIGLKTDMLSQQTGMDNALNIEDDYECQNPLISAQMEILDVNPHLLFVPSDVTVNRRRILPSYLKPRCLEDEGFYVCRRPQVHSKMMNKMDNRLIEEEKGQSWFGEDGCMITLPDPIQTYWYSYIDFPFSRQSPCLATVYTRPKRPGSVGCVATSEACETQWQLDLNLVGLFFTHHPLFSREHVWVQRLHELYEHYEAGKMKGATAFLQHKLNGLKKSEKALTATDENPGLKLCDRRQEIQKTHVALKKERQAYIALVRSIVAAWKCVKALRAENGYASTTVKLELHNVKARIDDSVPNTTENDKENTTMPYTDEDVAIKQHYLILEPQGKVEEEARPLALGQDEEMASDSVNQKLDQLALVPVVTMCGVVTPTTNCLLDEKVRRYKLAKHKITVKIFYNGKHVSTSEPSTFNGDFRVDIQQMFSMQLLHSPQKIMLEICETVKHKTTSVAKVYVPIPDRNMLSSNVKVARLEFSSDRHVKAYYAGVGSNVPFKLDEKEEEVCLMTSARLLYALSWSVDDCGYPMAPSSQLHCPSFTKPLASLPEASRLKWIRNLQFDPNHPHNTRLSELLREACWQRDGATGTFRLNHLEEEFDFSSEEQLGKCKRFILLQQRSSKAPFVGSSKPIPLHDRDISEAMLTHYDTSPRLSVIGEDPITMQRACSIHYIQTALNLIRTKLSNIKRKYKLSDIVKENHGANTPMAFAWDGFGPKRPLHPHFYLLLLRW
ncbi:hypothetical protein UPYG_G00321630 [Umbra pygmaea]|uniref:CC2D2A N-terminal C2 domain-containing protein n=1 Tax=Umbra pygmaea TaxID=75934 RepID=A0ABD0W1A4_UMBPY